MTLRSPPPFICDQRERGWELLEEGCRVEGEPLLELAAYLVKGEDQINGQVMRSRSLEMIGRAGQRHAERMLSQAEAIPTEWRQFLLVFPDTLWLGPEGVLYVPCLNGYGGTWGMRFDQVNHDHWNDRGRVIRVC